MPHSSVPTRTGVSTRTARTIALAVLALSVWGSARAQLPPDRTRQSQTAIDPDSVSAAQGDVVDLPDTIILKRFDPRFPVRTRLVPDSALSLAYVRYDPVSSYGPDYVGLGSLGLPATLNPVLEATYTRLRPPEQRPHPAYADREIALYEQNLPFTYTAYNQGAEIDDGQIRVLYGRPFANGWTLGLNYSRTYQSGEDDRYPGSDAQRIDLRAAVGFAPDSSRHRAYAWLQLDNTEFLNPGGYDFATSTAVEAPGPAFGAIPLSRLTTDGTQSDGLVTPRTDRRGSSYSYLHRYFLRTQYDSIPVGWAGSLEATLGRSRSHTNTTALGPRLDPGELFSVDDRGVRFAWAERHAFAEFNLEYYSARVDGRPGPLNFRAGAYAGEQTFNPEYAGDDAVFLAGLTGQLQGEVLRQFRLDATADLALGTRAGQGRVTGSLSWAYRDAFELGAEVLLERSSAPFSADVAGVNDVVLRDQRLPLTTHTQLGGRARYLPLGIAARGYLDVYTDPIVYAASGLAEALNADLAVPTLELAAPLAYRFLRFDTRLVARLPPGSDAVPLPAYTTQHALFARLDLFAENLELIVGLDFWTRSPTAMFGYSPILGTFTVPPDPAGENAVSVEAPWRYTLDAFLAIKAKAFKAFTRIDNVSVNDPENLPATTYGYPVVRGDGLFPGGSLLRVGVAFFLFN